MKALRSIVFAIALYSSLVLFLIVFIPVFALSSDDFAWAMTRRWARLGVWLHRTVVGARVAFEGLENIPKGAAIIASKHQSYWETLSYVAVLDRPAFILKKELMRLPLFGTYMRRLGMIPVDRTRRGATMNSMMAGARRAVGEGRPIVIFPEGTRTMPGAAVDYRPGVFMLYAELGVPVVPAALNSGVFWPKGRGAYQAGTIRAAFMPPIPPGLERPDLLAKVKAAVEAKSLELLRVAYAETSGLPMTASAAQALGERRGLQPRHEGFEPSILQAERRNLGE